MWGGLIPVLVLLALAAWPSGAADVKSVRVEHDSGVYRATVEALVDAPKPAVQAVLTDFARYTALNPDIRSSAVLAAPPEGPVRVHVLYRGCILFFCKTLDYTADFAVTEHGATGTVVPGPGVFRSGEIAWTLQGDEGSALIRTRSRLEPAFWVPPLIGPLLIRRKLHEEAERTILNVERQARNRTE